MKNRIKIFALILFAILIKVNAQTLTTFDYLIVAPSSFGGQSTWKSDLLSLQQSRGFTPYIYTVTNGTTTDAIKQQIAKT